MQSVFPKAVQKLKKAFLCKNNLPLKAIGRENDFKTAFKVNRTENDNTALKLKVNRPYKENLKLSI